MGASQFVVVGRAGLKYTKPSTKNHQNYTKHTRQTSPYRHYSSSSSSISNLSFIDSRVSFKKKLWWLLCGGIGSVVLNIGCYTYLMAQKEELEKVEMSPSMHLIGEKTKSLLFLLGMSDDVLFIDRLALAVEVEGSPLGIWQIFKTGNSIDFLIDVFNHLDDSTFDNDKNKDKTISIAALKNLAKFDPLKHLIYQKMDINYLMDRVTQQEASQPVPIEFHQFLGTMLDFDEVTTKSISNGYADLLIQLLQSNQTPQRKQAILSLHKLSSTETGKQFLLSHPAQPFHHIYKYIYSDSSTLTTLGPVLLRREFTRTGDEVLRSAKLTLQNLFLQQNITPDMQRNLSKLMQLDEPSMILQDQWAHIGYCIFKSCFLFGFGWGAGRYIVSALTDRRSYKSSTLPGLKIPLNSLRTNPFGLVAIFKSGLSSFFGGAILVTTVKSINFFLDPIIRQKRPLEKTLPITISLDMALALLAFIICHGAPLRRLHVPSYCLLPTLYGTLTSYELTPPYSFTKSPKSL